MCDAQASHEKTLTSLLPALAGANMLYGMGMLEMGMTYSYTQLVVDDEIANMVRRVIRGIKVDDDTLAVDIIRSVGGGSGKNFLMEEHTMEYVRTEQQMAKFFDRKPREDWVNAGAKDATVRAREKARHIFHSHKPEPLDAPTQKELQRIVASAE